MRSSVLTVAAGAWSASCRTRVPGRTIAVAAIADLDAVSSRCLEAALSVDAQETIAVHVHGRDGSTDEKRLQRMWTSWDLDVTLVTLWSADGQVGVPVRDWIRRRHATHQVELFTSELRRPATSGPSLHATEIEAALAEEPNVVVYHQLLTA
ncbi:MAG: hypothetical protein Q7T56_07750 [Nocardioidaceae bacterium]|nr:hypothetical protein [Nocardioidaceae bacterium]